MTWSDDQRAKIGDATELELASRRADVDTTFTDAAGDAPHDAIDTEYHRKYDRLGPGPVSHVTGPAAHPVTIRLARSEA